MCQHDALFVDEYKNPLIEFSGSFLFFQNNQHIIGQQIQPSENNSTDSVYLQLLYYWTCILNDPKNSLFIHIPYKHALYNIKSIFLSSGNMTKS